MVPKAGSTIPLDVFHESQCADERKCDDGRLRIHLLLPARGREQCGAFCDDVIHEAQLLAIGDHLAANDRFVMIQRLRTRP